MSNFGLELDLTVNKKGMDQGLTEARDDLDGFAKRIKDKTGIELSVKAAKLQVEMDKVNKDLKKAKKDNDVASVIELTAEKNILSNQLTGAKRELRNYARTGEKDLSVWGKKLNEVNQSINGQSTLMGKVSGAFGFLGTKLLAVLGPLAAFASLISGAKKLNAYRAEIEKMTNNIQIATGATGEMLDSFTAVGVSLSGKVKSSIEDISSVIGQLNTRLGLTGEALENAAEDFLNFARISGIDTGEAVKGVSKVMRQFGIDVEHTGAVLDVFTTAGQLADLSADRMSTTLAKNGAALQQMGFSLGESTALLAQMELAGLNADNIIQRMSANLARNTKEGESMGQAYARITEEIANASTETEAIDIATQNLSRVYGVQIASGIRNGTMSIDDMVTALEGSSGALDKVANDTLTFGDRIGMINKQILGKLSPALQRMGDSLATFFEKHGDTIVAVIGSIMGVFGEFFMFFVRTMGLIGQVFTNVMNGILGVFGISVQDLGGGVKMVLSFFLILFNRIRIGFLVIGQTVGALGSLIVTNFQSSINTVKGFFADLATNAGNSLSTITAVAGGVGQDITQTFKNVGHNIKAGIQAGANMAIESLNKLSSSIAGLFGGEAKQFGTFGAASFKNVLSTEFTNAARGASKKGPTILYGDQVTDAQNAGNNILSAFGQDGVEFNSRGMAQGQGPRVAGNMPELGGKASTGGAWKNTYDAMKAGRQAQNDIFGALGDNIIDGTMGILDSEQATIDAMFAGAGLGGQKNDLSSVFADIAGEMPSLDDVMGGGGGGGGKGGGGGSSDAIQEEIDKMTELAKARIEDIQSSEMSEEEKAEAIIDINDQLQEDIEKIKSTELQLDVANAKKVIENKQKAEKEKTNIAKKSLEDQRDLEIKNIQASEMTEAEKAQAILDINAKTKKEIDDLDKTFAQKQIEIAEKVMEEVAQIQEDASQEINDFYDNVADAIDDSIDKVVDYQKEIEQTKEEFAELEKRAIENIANINEELEELETNKANDLASRNIQLIEEQKKIQEDIEKLRNDADTPEKQEENAKKILEYEEQLKDIAQERQKIMENVSDDVLEEAIRRDGLNTTDRLLEDFDREKAILEERKAINEAIANGEEILLEDILDKQNRKIASELLVEREALESRLSQLEEQKNAEIAILEDLDQQRRLIEKGYTDFFDKEIAAREKRLDDLIAKQREAGLGGGIDGDTAQPVTQNNTFNNNISNEVDAESFLRNISERI